MSLVYICFVNILSIFFVNGLIFFEKRCNIHILSSDGHKWLMGPEGIGCFYCSKDILDELVPNNVGWNSVINESAYLDYDLTLRPNARRFEEGSLNIMGIYVRINDTRIPLKE